MPNILTPAIEVHLKKAACPIDVTVSGISINDISEGQLLNIPDGNISGIYVEGRIAVFNDVQPSKREDSIISTVLGIVICLRDMHPENTDPPSCFILGINVTLSRFTHFWKVP